MYPSVVELDACPISSFLTELNIVAYRSTISGREVSFQGLILEELDGYEHMISGTIGTICCSIGRYRCLSPLHLVFTASSVRPYSISSNLHLFHTK